jgi:hypothetical protein
VEIMPAAHHHGVSDDDIRHAVRNAFRTAIEEGFVMLTGPDQAGNPLEIGIRETAAGLVIFHAMPARDKYLR